MNKIINILLIAILIFFLINLYSDYKNQETNNEIKNNITIIEKKISYLEDLVKAKKDTIKILNNYSTKIIQQKDSIKNEIYNKNNIDSLIALYYQLRSINNGN